MKKLVLVTLLAVAASWLISEARHSVDDRPALVDTRHRGRPKPKPKSDEKPVLLVQDPMIEPAQPLPPGDPIDPMLVAPRRKAGKAQSKRPTTSPVRLTPKTEPVWFPKSEAEEQAKAQTDAFGLRVVVGRVSASEDRARQDLRLIVERQVSDWLSADVPPSWKVPPSALKEMDQGSYTQEVTRNLTAADPSAESSEMTGLDGLYTLYRAGQQLDFSPTRRARIIGIYRHDLATRRLQRLGGGMALALIGLAVLSGYIKADEATKGYYTNRLRLIAAAGLGVAGVAAYRYLV